MSVEVMEALDLAAKSLPPLAIGQGTVDTVPANTSTTFSVPVGGSTSGWINGVGDRDWYSVTLTAGESYNFNLDGSGATPLSDTYLYLYNSSGVQIGFDDDDGPGLNSLITYTALSSGTYYLGAAAFGDSYTGQYTLSAAIAPPLPTYTLDEIALQLTNGYWGGSSRQFVDPDNIITFNVTGLTAEAATLARLAFQLWDEASGLAFLETAGSAQITLDDTQSGAFASSSVSGGTIASSIVNIGADWLNAYGTSMYSYTFQTYIHEIGHALGLGHAGNYNGSATYGVDNHYRNDSWAYSVMSYFDQPESGYGSFRFVMTPQLGDLVAVQNLYGTNNTRPGDTVYGHNSNAGTVYSFNSYANAPAFTIFDSGGTDTLDTSGYSNAQTIDLNAETFSSIGGFVNNIAIARGVTIENAIGGSGADSIVGNSVDNDLTGGIGNDTLTGNNGNDTLRGGTGADSLIGGIGNDTYYFDGTDTIVETSGIDTVVTSVSYILASDIERGTLDPAGGLLDLLGNGLDNVLTGNDSRNGIAGGGGSDTIIAGGGDDAIDGQDGADSMVGGTGVDTYYVDNVGDAVVETEVGATLYDTVWTNLANYTLPDNVEIYIAIPGAGSINGVGNDLTTLMLGNEGANVLNSLGGNDIILGQDGNDTINSGLGGDPAGYEVISGGDGADSLTGGGGHDFFNYQSLTHGGDIITDFATMAGDDDDILDFRPMFPAFLNTAGITTVAEAVVSGHLTYTQAGADVQVFGDVNGGGDDNILIATLLNQTAANVQTYTLI